MRKGFTFVELMTVMAILVILLLVGIIYWSGFIYRYNLNSTSQVSVALLKDAQQRSVTQEDGKYWGVFFNNSNNASQDYFLLFNATDTIPTTMATSTLRYIKSGVDFLDPPVNSSTTVIFDKITGNLIKSDCPNATVSTTIQIATITNTSTTNTIKIYCNGKIESQ